MLLADLDVRKVTVAMFVAVFLNEVVRGTSCLNQGIMA